MNGKSQNRQRRRGGQSLLEFMFVGIPVVFILISVFEVSRGMWMYQTLNYAAKSGVRYAIVHGYNCSTVGNSCGVNLGPSTTAGTVSAVIRNAGAGLDPAKTKITFTANGSSTGPCALSTCGGGPWPPALNNLVGQTIRIDINTPFQSAISMFWPGTRGENWTTVYMYATSSDTIKF